MAVVTQNIKSYRSTTLREGRARYFIGLTLVTISIVAAVVSFFVLTGYTPIDPKEDVLRIIYFVNGGLIASVLLAIGIEMVRLARAWQQRRAGARLHMRIVALFSVIAALPAIVVVTVFSVVLDRGLDRWFEERTRQVVDNVLTVASAYKQEHARVLRSDIVTMATAFDQAKPLFDFEPGRFQVLFRTQFIIRGVQAAYLLDEDGSVITREEEDPARALQMPPDWAMAAAKRGEVALNAGTSNQISALVQLKEYKNTYLYVVRLLDPAVVTNLRLAQEAAVEYKRLEESRSSVQIAFGLVFFGFTLCLLLAAIWIGLAFANGLVAPIRALIGATHEIAAGNLKVMVPVGPDEDDLTSLGRTFNEMTLQLRTQRAELISASTQVDRRRRFTEAVLAGVSAAVLGLMPDGRISLVNRSAYTLLGFEQGPAVGRRLIDEIPELGPLFEQAIADDQRMHQDQLVLVRNGRERMVLARIASDRSPGREHGYVVTLDDITDLVSAQRMSVWADVARRIAHEIKNPLTPIQLAAERIRRRYGKQIDDVQVFNQCIETIQRQVGDIGRMVDEFSSFARMPKPTKAFGDLREILREAMFLISVANSDVKFILHLGDAPLTALVDQRLLTQALTNLIKNAVEAIAALPVEQQIGGQVDVHGRTEDQVHVIEVIDNGIGLPIENRSRLLEPYITTREKGTGLGLAIVRKIIEEHDGRIELVDSPTVALGGRGAMVRITLPASSAQEAELPPVVGVQK